MSTKTDGSSLWWLERTVDDGHSSASDGAARAAGDGRKIATHQGMMRPATPARGNTAAVSVIALAMTRSAPVAQTRIEPHPNSFKPQQDVEMASGGGEVRQQFHSGATSRSTRGVDRLGGQLVENIPTELRTRVPPRSGRQSQGINAFALWVARCS
jgi:hypothetical protein